MSFSEKALRLICEFEGIDQPGKWPGGASGVTLPIGYDLGYVDEATFARDWQKRLPAGVFERLRQTIGLRGQSANLATKRLGDIHIDPAVARDVLETATIPDYVQETRTAFPGFDRLPLDAQGALVSLVYNRGARMDDSNPVTEDRREMRAIRDAVAAYALHGSDAELQAIAEQLRSMKRLWKGKGLDGLIARREAEAQLVCPTAVEASA